MLLNRELSEGERQEVTSAVDDGITDLFDIAARVDPSRNFYPWEKILLGALFNPVLTQTGPISEGN